MRDSLKSDFFTLPKPRAIGHRGAAATHPENTMPSFAEANAAGAEYIELDVHMTRDGEIVVCHDENLKRTCGQNRLIREMTYAEVAAADAGRMFTLDGGASHPFRDKGIAPPKLSEVMAAFPKMRVIVEIKQTVPSLAAPLLGVIDRAGMSRMVVVASEHQEPLDEVRRLAPGIPTNFSYLEGGGFFQAMAAHDANYRPPGDALQIPPSYESWQLVTPESVAFAHRLGIEVHVWTVNEPAEMTRLLDIGVDGIISDNPRLLLDVLRRRAR
ncbi:MAG TPA: glycerophosphodiester phosphodiesterase [Candidatus Binataceae bacterium]|nr:glycerophosphodiester phosphodiesterase [Candidatus Binataceae bacterium]